MGSNRTRDYKVRSGDNLTLIAKANKVNVHDLQRWNKLSGQALRVGQILVVRDTYNLMVNSVGKNMVQYKVKRGDSLYIIARRFKVDMRHLRHWNPLASQVLKPGQMLVVYRPR